MIDVVPAAPFVAERGSAVLADSHPALVYLARLAPGSERTMQQALEVIAVILSTGRATPFTLP